MYQLRQVSQILQSSVPTNILSLEQPHTQYIYVDDPRFKGICEKLYIKYNDLLIILCGINLNLFIIFLDVLMLRKVENLQSSVPIQSLSFNHTVMKWWKSLTRNVAYKLLYIAQHGNVRERLKALCTLNSLKHLKSIF